MFEKVLVGIALSPATEALVSALPAMGELGTREFSLVHVAKPFHEPVSQSLTRLEKLRSRVGALADRLREDGFAVTIDVPTGAPAAAVLKVAESRDPDVVLIGSRSRSPIKDAFIGSVAWDIVRGVGRPVLLQRIDPIRAEPEEALETRGRGLPTHVIYPTDFSATAAQARPWVLGLAEAGARAFTLIHVVPTASAEQRREAEGLLEPIAEELRDQGATQVNCRVLLGTPFERIMAHGATWVDALVVMGTHGRGRLPEVVLGSVSRRVLRHASARVLLVPADTAA